VVVTSVFVRFIQWRASVLAVSIRQRDYVIKLRFRDPWRDFIVLRLGQFRLSLPYCPQTAEAVAAVRRGGGRVAGGEGDMAVAREEMAVVGKVAVAGKVAARKEGRQRPRAKKVKKRSPSPKLEP
jgi:hypothetical protein